MSKVETIKDEQANNQEEDSFPYDFARTLSAIYAEDYLSPAPRGDSAIITSATTVDFSSASGLIFTRVVG